MSRPLRLREHLLNAARENLRHVQAGEAPRASQNLVGSGRCSERRKAPAGRREEKKRGEGERSVVFKGGGIFTCVAASEPPGGGHESPGTPRIKLGGWYNSGRGEIDKEKRNYGRGEKKERRGRCRELSLR